jgi:hypothetical protein
MTLDPERRMGRMVGAGVAGHFARVARSVATVDDRTGKSWSSGFTMSDTGAHAAAKIVGREPGMERHIAGPKTGMGPVTHSIGAKP